MRHVAAAAATSLLALATPTQAADIEIGAGVVVDLGTASMDTGEGDLDVAGTLSSGTQGFDARDVTIQPTGVLNGESAMIQVCGDWANTGTFNAGASTVMMIDGCGVASAVISGDTTFANLDLSTTTGKAYSFTSGSTQTVTGSLTLMGATGNLLTLRSTTGGVLAFLDKQGTSVADFVDVDDIDAGTGNQIGLGPNSVQGPNTPGFFGPVFLPVMGLLGLSALAGSLLWGGQRALATRGGSLAGH